MKKDRLLNPDILSAVATLGHTETLCVGDCGLPVPRGTRVIDVSVSAGIPAFLDVLNAISEELVVESIIVATEIDEKNPAVMDGIKRCVGDVPVKRVPHETLKDMLKCAKCVIRTGETSPFANVLLVGGVNF